jgi:hypothetical protein
MRRSVTVPLEGFARECAQRCAREHGLTLPDLLTLAAGYYLDACAGRPARVVPPMVRRAGPRSATDHEVELPVRQWDALAAEARDQDVDLGTLIEHAVLLLAADLDSGRVAARVAG